MALRNVFRRKDNGASSTPAPSLAAAPGAETQPLAPAWARLDGLAIAELVAAARRDAEDALARRRGGGRIPAEAQRSPQTPPPGPRSQVFLADARRRAGLGPVSDARSLTPPWAAICEVEAHFDGARQQGVGYRVGRHLVLTAAHLLARPDLGEARSLALYSHNGADRALQPIAFRLAPNWRARLAKGASLHGEDDFAAIIVAAPHEDPSAPFPYLPVQAVRRHWFAKRPSARYRLVGAAARPGEEALEAHRLYEASDFVSTEMGPRLSQLLESGRDAGAKTRFWRSCIRHRIRAPEGFAGAPLLAALHDRETDRVYEAAVGLHLGASQDEQSSFGVARMIDEEVKRRLLVWAQEARKLAGAQRG